MADGGTHANLAERDPHYRQAVPRRNKMAASGTHTELTERNPQYRRAKLR